MKRFGQLEFEDSQESPGGKPAGGGVRDARYFCREGLKAYLGADYELALRNYSRALEKDNAFYDGWIGQVFMLIELGEYPEALLWADKALEMFPEHPEILAAKGLACIRDAKGEEALAYSDNSVAKENTTGRVWLVRAEIMLSRNSKMVESCIHNAIGMGGKMAPLIRLEAGRLLARHKKYSQALEYLASASRAIPRSALAWYEYGCCLNALGFPEARAALEQAVSLAPDWGEPAAALKKVGKRGIMKMFSRRG